MPYCACSGLDDLVEAQRKAKKGAFTSDMDMANSAVEKVRRRERARVCTDSLEDSEVVGCKQGSCPRTLIQPMEPSTSKRPAVLLPPPVPPPLVESSQKHRRLSYCENLSQSSSMLQFSQLREHDTQFGVSCMSSSIQLPSNLSDQFRRGK